LSVCKTFVDYDDDPTQFTRLANPVPQQKFALAAGEIPKTLGG
jgi:hypothetical protein